MNQPTTNNWWLISSEDARAIEALLLRLTKASDVPPQVQQDASEALHTLVSGLNATDAVPADFAEDAPHDD